MSDDNEIRFLLTGRTINPEDYDQPRLEFWQHINERAASDFPGGVPDFHPEGTPWLCYECGIQVSLGPKQQLRALEERRDTAVVCWICMITEISINQRRLG